MARMRIDIDEEDLAQVSGLLGTTNRKETVAAALRAVIAQYRRTEAVGRMLERSHNGELDDVIAPGRRAEAWR